jgi:hypothetical protein
VGYERGQIFEAIRYHLNNGHASPDPIYGDGRAGERIANLLSTQPLSIEKMLTY